MKLEDYIHESITQYPGLYCAKTYEEARIKVLDHLFLTLGNGMEWAWTKDPKKGGYLTEPIVKKVKGEWERKYDPPYGKLTFHNPEIHRYFDGGIYVRIMPLSNKYTFIFYDSCDSPAWRGFLNDAPEDFINKCITNSYYKIKEKYTKYPDVEDLPLGHLLNTNDPSFVVIQENKNQYSWKPYPFSVKYWPIDEIDLELIQPDWKQGAIDIFEAALEYYYKGEMDDHWKGSDFSEIIIKYKDKGVDALLKDYGMSYDLLPEFLGVDLNTVDEKQYGEILKKTKYEKETKERIDALEDRLRKLK